MKTNLNKVLEGYLTKPKDREAFYLWAFCFSSFSKKATIECMHAWNKYHGNQYMLTEGGHIYRDLPIMVDMWKQRTINS